MLEQSIVLIIPALPTSFHRLQLDWALGPQPTVTEEGSNEQYTNWGMEAIAGRFDTARTPRPAMTSVPELVLKTKPLLTECQYISSK